MIMNLLVNVTASYIHTCGGGGGSHVFRLDSGEKKRVGEGQEETETVLKGRSRGGGREVKEEKRNLPKAGEGGREDSKKAASLFWARELAPEVNEALQNDE